MEKVLRESRDWFTSEQIELRLNNQLSRKHRVEWIKQIQEKYTDRLFIDIDWDNYNIEEIYENLVIEYDNRKNIIKK